MKTRFLIIAITVPIAVLGIIFSPILVEMYYLEQKYQQIGYPQDFDIENCKDIDQCTKWFENGTCHLMFSKRCLTIEDADNYPNSEALNMKLIQLFQDKPEVKAFYEKYPDANVSVRDDHVSYVVGSDDDFKVRMNLYFDENYELDQIDFHCYFQREHQHDVPSTFIQKYLQEYECEKRPEPEHIPIFADGVTEIINPEFERLKHRVTSPTIDDTYLSKNVQQWQDAWQNELEAGYEKYGDNFYTELGRLLIKNEMQNQMDTLGIVNANHDFEVFSGMMLTSLPPYISFSAVILATDENYYRLQGGTHENRVNYYSTTQLQFPDTTEKLSMESIVSKPQLITIIPEDGNKARQEPSTLVVHVDNNTVEFFNNTPEIIRIQDSGSGRIGEENTLAWMGPTILPYQKATMTFDKPGLIEWDARNAPNLEDPLWWSTHAGGNIVILSDDMDDFSSDDKARIAQTILHNSDIPIFSSGAGNAEKVLKLGLDPAVTKVVPNAEEYYLQRAKQLIPFDVEIILE